MSYFNSPSIDAVIYSDDDMDMSQLQLAMNEHFRNADFRRKQRRRLSSPVTPVFRRKGGVSPLRSHPPEMPNPKRNTMSIAVPLVRQLPTRTSSTSSASSVPSLVSSPGTPQTPMSPLSPGFTDPSVSSLKDLPFSPVTPFFPLHTNCNCPTASMYVVDLPSRNDKGKKQRKSHPFNLNLNLNLNLNRTLNTLMRKTSKSTLSVSVTSSPPSTPTKSKASTPSLLSSSSSSSSSSASASNLSLTEDVMATTVSSPTDLAIVSPIDLIKIYETGQTRGWASHKSPLLSPTPSTPIVVLDDDDADQSIRLQLQELELCYIELQEGRKRLSSSQQQQGQVHIPVRGKTFAPVETVKVLV